MNCTAPLPQQGTSGRSRRIRRVWIAAPLLTGMTVVCGCGGPESSAQKPSIVEELAVNRVRRDPQAAARLRGRAVYEHYCARCHGADGQGNGFNSTLLKVPPRNFTDSAFRKRATDERLTKAIRGGGPAVGKSVLMPPWGRTLSAKQIADVVAFLKSLKPPPKNQAQQGT